MEVRWSRAGGVFVDVKRRGPSRRDFTAGCGGGVCAAHWDHSLREGTRSGIISSTHPGDAADIGQRRAISTSVEDERDARNEDRAAAATCRAKIS